MNRKGIEDYEEEKRRNSTDNSLDYHEEFFRLMFENHCVERNPFDRRHHHRQQLIDQLDF